MNFTQIKDQLTLIIKSVNDAELSKNPAEVHLNLGAAACMSETLAKYLRQLREERSK